MKGLPFKKLRKFFSQNFLVIFVFLLSFLVFCTNLSSQEYSFDEPETVVIAKSISKNVLPTAWDGKSFTTGTNGLDSKYIFGKYIWTWHPWLEFYAAFAGIKIFGESAGGARFFFAFAGFLTVVVFYFISLEFFKNKWIALLLSLHLVFLLPFFLYVRQARYYSLVTLFSLATFYLFVKYWQSHWKAQNNKILLVSTLLLFFSNSLMWASSIFMFCLALLLKKRRNILPVLLVNFLVAFVWNFIFKPQGGQILFFNPGFENILSSATKFLSYINSYIFPFILFIPFLVLFIKKKTGILYLLILLWIGIKLLFMVIFLSPHGRYVVELSPLFILLLGFIYKYLFEKKWFLLIPIFFILFTFTHVLNNLSRPFLKKINYPNILNAYKVELFEYYPGAMSQVGAYLKKNYKEGDLYMPNAYFHSIYLYSGVPQVSTNCDIKTKKLKGVNSSITNPNKIRWIIVFQNDSRLPKEIWKNSCFDKKWMEEFKKFKKFTFKFKEPTYFVNDPDIANRLFPPRRAYKDEVVIYERE